MPSFSENKLILDTGRQVSFKHDIDKVVSFDNVVVVLLKMPSGIIFNENVFGVSLDGQIRWQIQSLLPDMEDSPHINIKRSANGLDAYNWSGLKTRVDLKTGKIVDKRITK